MDSNMKKIIKSFVPLLLAVCIMLLGMMVSCTSDDDSGGDVTAGISLHIKPVTRVEDGSVNTGLEAENKIDNVHVWFFAENASDGEPALYYYTPEPEPAISSTNGELVLNITDEELMLHHNMNSQGTYQLFVVANLPADATIGADTSLGNLKTYSYGASARPDSPFCMTGSTNGAHDFAIDSRITIPLLRVASRLDVKIVNITGKTLQVNKVSIADDQKSVQLFAPESSAPVPISDAFGTATDIYTTATTTEVNCSGYVYENRSSSPIKVVVEGSIDGNSFVWKADIKPDGLTTLMRNTICEVTLKLKDVEPTDVECTIAEWYGKNMNSAIHGTYLNTNSNHVEVTYALGGSLNVLTDAKSIEVDLTDAEKFYLSGHENESNVIVPVNDGTVGLTVRLKGQSNDIVPDGKIIIKAGNLSKTITVSKKETALIFNLMSVQIEGKEVKDGDHITISAWENKQNTNMTITMESNMQWAYDVNIFRVLDGTIATTFRHGIIRYNGSTTLFTKNVLMQYDGVMYPDLLPVEVVLDLFINNYEVAYGSKMQTFKFTIDKP